MAGGRCLPLGLRACARVVVTGIADRVSVPLSGPRASFRRMAETRQAFSYGPGVRRAGRESARAKAQGRESRLRAQVLKDGSGARAGSRGNSSACGGFWGVALYRNP